MALAYRYLSFLITRINVKVLTVMTLWMQFIVLQDMYPTSHLFTLFIYLFTLCYLLPLLRDKFNTLDMQLHTMNLKKEAISALDLGQTSVDVWN